MEDESVIGPDFTDEDIVHAELDEEVIL